ncbi:helix-turn-helix transcriptional regulator [Burkholderia sp. Tr-20390]|uniref:helix-turn-helix domain-containing protein n=1 Tax=Burkholderia sp. Tr-20390 TaxID=2703904 RepID=UPI0019815313|nr:helix-turn-helix transcriptional regulator [Burkholderia sp. Tr-20390]MBN3733178.1 helix-turn-helix transcriptional regulator [Burkholderia sp. Tr-20390]
MNWQTIVEELTNRAAGGWTQVELAKECGCGQSTISDLVRGTTEQPGGDLALQLLALHKKLKARQGRAEDSRK